MKEEKTLTELVLEFNSIKALYFSSTSRIAKLELLAKARYLIHEMEEAGISVDNTDTFINTIKLYPISFEEVNMAIQEAQDIADKQLKMDCEISKINEDQNLVFGWAYVSETAENGTVVDYQGDSISEDELEKAFYDFVINARNAGEMHKSLAGTLVECMVFTKQKQQALGIDLGKVGAWVGFKLQPEVFAKVKSGEYKMLSIGGKAKRIANN